MQRVGCQHQNKVYVWVLDDVSPIMRDEFRTVIFGRGFQAVTSPGTESNDAHVIRSVTNFFSVRSAYESSRPDYANAKFHAMLRLIKSEIRNEFESRNPKCSQRREVVENTECNVT
jgi:hypothetical protein